MDALHPYQRRALAHVLANPRCALWMEPGLGKTIVALRAAEALLDSVDVRHVLVVAPLRVAISTWPEEIAKWGIRATYQVVHGAKEQLEQATTTKADIHIVNYENLVWVVRRHASRWPWDMVILDESSRLKNQNTRRWRAIKHVREVTPYLVELTGTPAPNGLIDLWAQIYLLDLGQRLFRTLTLFRKTWFDKSYCGFTYDPKLGADEVIHAAVSDIVLTLRAEDYLDLPDLVPVNVPVRLPPAARALYDQLSEEMFLALQQGDVTAETAAALSNKCRQCAAGALYLDAEKGTRGPWQEVHRAKLDALQDLVDETAGEPLLVLYNYRFDLARLQTAFPQARGLDDDPQTIVDWNAGRIPMLLTHPASGGFGLNLQAGGHMIVWFSIDWNLEYYLQANARLHRQGQDRPVFIYHLIATDTVDELVLERLRSKRTVQDVLLDALKVQIGP